MLIAKIYINRRVIDNIYIHNTGEIDGDKMIYRLMDPGTMEVLTKTTIAHKRGDGYRKLLIKVLELMGEEDLPTISHVPTMFG